MGVYRPPTYKPVSKYQWSYIGVQRNNLRIPLPLIEQNRIQKISMVLHMHIVQQPAYAFTINRAKPHLENINGLVLLILINCRARYTQSISYLFICVSTILHCRYQCLLSRTKLFTCSWSCSLSKIVSIHILKHTRKCAI